MISPQELLYKACSRKDCEHAGILQPVSNFGKTKRIKNGLISHCKSCANKMSRKNARLRYHLDPEKSKAKALKRRNSESHKKWYARRKDELNAATKAWCAANPEEVRKLRVRRRFRQYGVTEDWYARTLEEQGGKCAICESSDPKASWPTFHVDHNHNCCIKSCHACDKCRRGLLCAVCNTRLGILEDREWIGKAEKYLEQYRK